MTLQYSATGLPTGVSIDEDTGVVAGTPTVTGVFPVTVTATADDGNSASQTFNLTVESG